ncbi:hypothetical protein TUM3811_28200 [Shewanella algae]|nr:hypothetical protein TUM3811_28200 [Shewanella algae]
MLPLTQINSVKKYHKAQKNKPQVSGISSKSHKDVGLHCHSEQKQSKSLIESENILTFVK